MVKEFKDKQVLILSVYGEEYVVVDEDDNWLYIYSEDGLSQLEHHYMEDGGWIKFKDMSVDGKKFVIEAFNAYDVASKIINSY